MKRIIKSILLVALISNTKISYSMDVAGTSGTVGAEAGEAGTPGDGVPVAVQAGSKGEVIQHAIEDEKKAHYTVFRPLTEDEQSERLIPAILPDQDGNQYEYTRPIEIETHHQLTDVQYNALKNNDIVIKDGNAFRYIRKDQFLPLTDDEKSNIYGLQRAIDGEGIKYLQEFTKSADREKYKSALVFDENGKVEAINRAGVLSLLSDANESVKKKLQSIKTDENGNISVTSANATQILRCLSDARSDADSKNRNFIIRFLKILLDWMIGKMSMEDLLTIDSGNLNGSEKSQFEGRVKAKMQGIMQENNELLDSVQSVLDSNTESKRQEIKVKLEKQLLELTLYQKKFPDKSFWSSESVAQQQAWLLRTALDAFDYQDRAQQYIDHEKQYKKDLQRITQGKEEANLTDEQKKSILKLKIARFEWNAKFASVDRPAWAKWSSDIVSKMKLIFQYGDDAQLAQLSIALGDYQDLLNKPTSEGRLAIAEEKEKYTFKSGKKSFIVAKIEGAIPAANIRNAERSGLDAGRLVAKDSSISSPEATRINKLYEQVYQDKLKLSVSDMKKISTIEAQFSDIFGQEPEKEKKLKQAISEQQKKLQQAILDSLGEGKVNVTLAKLLNGSVVNLGVTPKFTNI